MMYCPQEPGPQYPQADFTAANAFIASSLDAAVVPNVDGISVFVTPITSRTFDETASGDFTMQVPPTDPVPPAPTLQPVPTVDPQHLYDSKAKQQQIVDANTKAIRDYQAALGKEQAQLQQVRAQVKTQTDSLRRFIPPADPDPKDASDWGCVAKASDRLGGVSGQRWLVLSSAMDETEWVDRLPGINLAGVKVRVLFYFCRDSGTCRYKQSTWRSAFARAGVTDLAFADAQSSALLPPLFGPGQ